jgi:hypothetical protein
LNTALLLAARKGINLVSLPKENEKEISFAMAQKNKWNLGVIKLKSI